MPDFNGTPGDDRLIGTDDDDTLNGPAGTDGNDTLNGAGGNDRLFGGRGNDVLDGGDGDDLLDGGDGGEDAGVTFGTTVVFGGGDFASYRSSQNAVTVSLLLAGMRQNTGQGWDTLIGIEGLYGSNFNDVLIGDDGTNILSGLGGSDQLFGGLGADILLGGDGDDILEGGEGNDEIYGGAGTDVMRGGAGDDVLTLYHGASAALFGGDGDDQVIFSYNNTISVLDGGAGIDTISLSVGYVRLSGFSAANGFELFLGTHSAGSFVGTAEDDTFDFSSLTAVNSPSVPGFPPIVSVMRARGGAGNDTMIGMAADGADDLTGDEGDDVLRGMGGDDILHGGTGHDRVEGGDGNDHLMGGDGDDILLGGAGNDVISSVGYGSDTIDGGDGDDVVTIQGTVRSLQGGAGVDTLIFGGVGTVLGAFSSDNGFERFGGTTGGWALQGTIDANVLDFSGLSGVGVVLEIQAGGGDDIVSGLIDGSNTLSGDIGDDLLRGGDMADTLSGGDGADQLHGGGGNDRLLGGNGDDILFGGDGDDVLDGGFGTNRLDGGAGSDLLIAASGHRLVANLALGTADTNGTNTLVSIENLTGGSLADMLIGDDAANRLLGMGGSDTLSGGGGSDYLDGGLGDDQLEGGAGSDTLIGGDGYDTAVFDVDFADVRISYVDGATLVVGSQGTDRLVGIERLQFRDGYKYLTPAGYLLPEGTTTNGTDGDDRLVGSAGPDNLLGGRGNDVLLGGDGDDYILGEDGNDWIDGGTGSNSLFGGGGADTFVWRPENGAGLNLIDGGSGVDTLDLSGQGVGGRNSELVIVSGPTSDSFQVRLTANGATIIQSVGVERLIGGAGNDTYQLGAATIGFEINAGGGDDRISTGSGNDIINAGDGNDLISAGSGGDQVDGGAGIDTLVFNGMSRDHLVRNIQGVQLDIRPPGGGPGATIARNVENLSFVDGMLTYDATSVSAQVMRLYSATLNRAPDQVGLEANVAAAARIGLLGLADNFVQSAEFQTRFGSLTDQQFVEQLYVFALGRQGEPAGVATWVAAMRDGATPAQIVVAFSESAEHQVRTAPTLAAGLWVPDTEATIIARLYDATFDRLPDIGGLTAWAAMLKGGRPLLEIAGAFAGSAEFQARYGAVSNEQFVRQMYQFCLNREPDADGLAGWVNALNSGVSRAQILLNFSESAEHIALTAAFWLGGIRYEGYGGPVRVELENKGLYEALVLPGDLDTLAEGPQSVLPMAKNAVALILPADPVDETHARHDELLFLFHRDGLDLAWA